MQSYFKTTRSPFHATQPGQVERHLDFNTRMNVGYMSVEELRKLGIPETNIAIIERHRPALQRLGQHMLSQLQQGQISQMNFTIPQMPTIRFDAPGQAGEAGDISQMHPGNVMQSQVYTRPTAGEMNSAREFIRRAAAEQTAELRQSYQPQIMRDAERPAYVHSFKPLFESVVEMEKKIVMFHALFQNVLTTQKMITIILTVKEQNRLLSTNQFIFPISAAPRLATEIQKLVDNRLALVGLLPSSNPPSNPPPNPPPPAEINGASTRVAFGDSRTNGTPTNTPRRLRGHRHAENS